MKSESKHGSSSFAERTPFKKSRSLTLLGLVLLILITVAIEWQFARSSDRLRAEASDQAKQRGTQVISATSTAVSILVRTVDITSRELAASFVAEKSTDFAEQVRRAIARLPPGSIHQVAVIGADGYMLYSSLGTGEKLFLGDREHFRVHLGRASDQLFISSPVLGRVSRQWSIQFSRPILQDGQFRGVLVMSVSPLYIQQALQNIALGSDDVITVLRQSGEMIAINQRMEEGLGQRAPAGYASGTEPLAAGNSRGRSQGDPLDRLFHWQPIDGYPITVLLSLSEVSAFRSVERDLAEDRVKTFLMLCLLWSAALGIFALARRVNAQVIHHEKMEFLAMNDALTGLASRHALMTQLKQAIDQAAAAGQTLGILYMDLNGFKPINDQYGHATGDDILKIVGARIKSCVRSNDMAARIGGDEFVVVLSPMSTPDDLLRLQKRVAESIAQPIRLDAIKVSLGVSIGWGVFPEHGMTADAMLAHADKEMYRNKATHVQPLSLEITADLSPATAT